MTSGISPRLLSDAPASEDRFGAHQRIADAIQALVHSNDGGKTIALAGDWGSGKSTVIQLLALRNRDSGTLVHVFDAWAHSGDPLRRAFLVSLVDALQTKKWLDRSETWKRRLETLARRVKESTQRSQPVFTSLGKWVAAVLLLVPIGMTLTSELIRTLSRGGQPGVPLWAGPFLALAPLLLMLVARWRSRSTTGSTTDDVLGLLLNRVTLEQTVHTLETADPTSIEFQQVFESAMDEAMQSEGSDRRLVLVIDNLDRLNQQEQGQVWSLLRSFTDAATRHGRPWVKNVWLLIPIAPRSRQSPVDVSQEEGREDFLDKVFQVRFNLPPPMLSHWRAYLKQSLKGALGDIDEQDEERIAGLPPSLRTLRLATQPPFFPRTAPG